MFISLLYSSAVQGGGNENHNLFNLFLDYALHIYKHRCEEMGTGHLSIPYDTANESSNRKQEFLLFLLQPMY